MLVFFLELLLSGYLRTFAMVLSRDSNFQLRIHWKPFVGHCLYGPPGGANSVLRPLAGFLVLLQWHCCLRAHGACAPTRSSATVRTVLQSSCIQMFPTVTESLNLCIWKTLWTSYLTEQWREFHPVLVTHIFGFIDMLIRFLDQKVNTFWSKNLISTVIFNNPQYIQDWTVTNWKLGWDKTKLSCLVASYVHTANTDKTRQDSLSCLDPVSVSFCLVSAQFPISKFLVILNMFETEQFQVGNWVETRQNCPMWAPRL